MFRTVFALCLCGIMMQMSSAFMISHGRNVRLNPIRALAFRKNMGLSAHASGRKSACTGVTMKLPSQRDPTPEEIEAQRAYEVEMEKRYIKENSGLGYRKNSQDSLLAFMGMWPRLVGSTSCSALIQCAIFRFAVQFD
jgi:hypothetical protein